MEPGTQISGVDLIMPRSYQVGYRSSDGKVKYCHMSYEDGQKYNHLKSDEERKVFLQNQIDKNKIQDALNRW